jgi:hypothetical protein
MKRSSRSEKSYRTEMKEEENFMRGKKEGMSE